ncbi:MAG TPA: hypothetical protein VI454_14435 [Verrucomicrobiae bacterium]
MADPSPAPIPPDQPTVVARSLCLGSLILRGILERAIQSPAGPEFIGAHREFAVRLSQWLNEQDWTANFTLEELAALSQMPGTWDQTHLDAQNRRIESLGVLFWALSIHQEFPPYDEPFELPNLEPLLGWTQGALTHPNDTRLVNFPHTASGWFKQVTQLRPAPIIASRRAAAECWQWRAHVAALQRTGVPSPTGQDYPTLIAIAAEEAHAAGAIPKPLERDFPLFDQAFGALSEDELAEAATIASGRRIALDWLCGFATEWDNVPVAPSV